MLFTKDFTRGEHFTVPHLLVSSLIVFVLTAITFGSAMPAGLYIPNMLLGACLGRAVGEMFRNGYPHADVHPGVYALMGAAGLLAGFTRLTIALTMIMLMPLMLTILASKAVADRLVPSLYHIILELN